MVKLKNNYYLNPGWNFDGIHPVFKIEDKNEKTKNDKKKEIHGKD